MQYGQTETTLPKRNFNYCTSFSMNDRMKLSGFRPTNRSISLPFLNPTTVGIETTLQVESATVLFCLHPRKTPKLDGHSLYLVAMSFASSMFSLTRSIWPCLLIALFSIGDRVRHGPHHL